MKSVSFYHACKNRVIIIIEIKEQCQQFTNFVKKKTPKLCFINKRANNQY